MRVVVDGKVLDTDESTVCHRAPSQRGSAETLYLSDEGQLFLVLQDPAGTVEFTSLDMDQAAQWLDERGAPDEAYQEVGIELEEDPESPANGGFRRILSVVGAVSVRAADGLIWVMRNIRPDARRIQPTERINWPKWYKPTLMRRQHSTCVYCGYRRTASNLEIDHIVPVVRGGGNELENLQVICRPCNLRKGMQTDTEFRARYSRLVPRALLTPPRRRISQREFNEETRRTTQAESVRQFRRTRFISMRERVLTGCLVLGIVVALALYLALAGVGLPEGLVLWPSLVLGAAAGLGVLLRAHLTGAMLEDSELTQGEAEDTVNNP